MAEQIAEYRDERGEIVVHQHVPGVLSSRASGFLTMGIAKLLIDVADRQSAMTRRGVVHFMDWRDVTGYDSEGRTLCTNWAVRTKPSPELHILSSARLVRMGVTAAAMLLTVAGRDMALRSYEALAVFERALDERVASMAPRARP